MAETVPCSLFPLPSPHRQLFQQTLFSIKLEIEPKATLYTAILNHSRATNLDIENLLYGMTIRNSLIILLLFQ
jgi:hypothetical protein